MTRINLALTMVLVLAACNRPPENEFVGDWQLEDKEYHLTISTEMAVTGTIPIVLWEERSKSKPGFSIHEGNWEIMDGTPYQIVKTIDGVEHVVDAANWSMIPKYTSVKLVEEAADGNVYLNQHYADALINAKSRRRDQVLDVYVQLKPKDSSAIPPAGTKEIVLFTATIQGGELCLSSTELKGLPSNCLRMNISDKE